MSSSISVIVPAHNEEDSIDQCVASLRRQRVEDLQIIVVADRCTDQTEAMVSAHAREDDRVLLVRNTSRPPTWAGKCHAARLGANHATGDWLAFVDADTQANPDLLRAAVSEATRRETALLSLLTDLECRAWFERCTQPVASMALMSLFPPDSVNRDDRKRTFANGQFMLFDREFYERVGGHAEVKDDLLEDMAFARLISRNGGRVNVLRADGLLGCSMYADHEAFQRGWMRIFLEADHRRPRDLKRHAWQQLLMGWGLPGASIASLVMGCLVEGWPGDLAVIAGATALVLQLVALSWAYRVGRQAWWSVILFPLGTWDVFRIMQWAARALRSGEPIQWGGREYVIPANE